jgi:UDP-N-acetylmuramoyl-L-alanyl-D-glutamate--2,6-diaminopimelate ligase
MDLQGFLAQMVAAGIDRCILEATSHGLAQHRVAACEFDIGIVTNITHEHLDFHGSYQAYREAKGLLFKDLGSSPLKPSFGTKAAVLNCDDESYRYLKDITTVETIGYGSSQSADVRFLELITSSDGIHFQICDRQGERPVSSPLLGGFNAYNLIAAYSAAVYGFDLDPNFVVGAIQKFRGVPGRMERFSLGQRFTAIVDFAHTPNALKRALEASRNLCQGRIICVFGSAGLRDREKRQLMAKVSTEFADLTVLTAEDPRTESLAGILEEMAEGAIAAGGKEGETFWRIEDRGEAIRFGVRLAEDTDLVIICGKGHEQSMCFGTTEHPWDDRIAMQAALSELLEIEGPAMPWLPTRGS